VDGVELMNSRLHLSEEELAKLGCLHLKRHKAPRVLIGGLGMGYTLRAALDFLGDEAEVVVSELFPFIVDWNEEHLGELNGHPLSDPRVDVQKTSVLNVITRSTNTFDSILMDVDNGPGALVDAANSRLYGDEGVWACRNALRDRGCLAVWSVEPSKSYERVLTGCGLHVRRYRIGAYPGSKAPSRFIWVASEDVSKLPPGGGAPK
jgi:spermidine synthase